MAFFIASSPHAHSRKRTSDLMRAVAICALPGLVVQTYYFGWGTLIQLVFAILLGLALEAAILLVRKRPVSATLNDGSALVTCWLLAIAIPPLSPWWVIAIGLFFAIVIAKQLYGGLGQNPFNPAMVAYVVLLISFPLQMTSWLSPVSLSPNSYSFGDALSVIFTGFDANGLSLQQMRAGIDGVTTATPLDAIKTGLKNGHTISEITQDSMFSGLAGIGWQWVNISYLIGGLVLLKLRVIQWHIPMAMLGTLLLISSLSALIMPGETSSPIMHLLSGATMLGAFFIATDPVSASTTKRGRLIYGAFIGVMIFVIRTWGGFPDGVAFAVLLANMGVPLIDYYTKPRTYGH